MDDKTPRVEEHEEPVKPPRKAKLVSITIVEHRGASALVQWNVGTPAAPDVRRGYVPFVVAKEGAAPEAALEAAAPYGLDWERVFKDRTITASEFSRALRTKGIFTLEDLSHATVHVGKLLYNLLDIAGVIRSQKAKEK